MRITKNKKATSIIEALIVMLIIVMGVTGMYKIYIQSIRLSNYTENKIKAIQIASQGIEAVTNIRDTNWLLFSSDTVNCWNAIDYQDDCIGDNLGSYTIDESDSNTSYIAYRDGNTWKIGQKDPSTNYLQKFRVYLDSDGIYTQDTSTPSSLTTINPLYTREIKIEYLDADEQKMLVTSLVKWRDNSSAGEHTVELKQNLTNWKK